MTCSGVCLFVGISPPFIQPRSNFTPGPVFGGQVRLALSIIVLLVMMACTTSDREEEPRTGDPAIYERIESLTDCEALQIEFNLAQGNLARTRHDDNEGRENYRSYAETAEDRLDELRC